MASALRQNPQEPDSNAVFRHQRLANNATQIRLLQVQSSLEYDQTRCKLEHFYFDSLPPYYALSYRWGTTSDRISIQIGNQLFQAVPNAWWALQHLELRAGDYIWIDSICIDQSNVEERNTQVALMSRIYSQASEVFVWLGLEVEQTAIAFEALQSAVRFSVQRPNRRSIERYGSALQQLFENEYWSRTWIVQEIISARKLTIVCGKERVTWDFLDSFFTTVVSKWKSALSVGTKRPPASIEALSKTSANALVNSRPEFRKQQQEVKGCRASQLFEFLSKYRDSQCLDPRDKIYGLLGLFNSIASVPMKIDYSKTTEELLVTGLSYTLEGMQGTRALLVAELLQGLLGISALEKDFQIWLRPRLRFRIDEEYFRCRLSSSEILNLPIAVNLAVRVCPVPTRRLLQMQDATREEIHFWIDPLDQLGRTGSRHADWLWQNKDLLCSAIRDMPTTACLALKQTGLYEGPWSTSNPIERRRPREVVNCMTQSYSEGASLGSGTAPQAFLDEQGNVGVVCSKAEPGDIVCRVDCPSTMNTTPNSSIFMAHPSSTARSDTTRHTPMAVHCVLRPAKTGYKVVGSAYMVHQTTAEPDRERDLDQSRERAVERNVGDAFSEYHHLFLDPLNAMVLSASNGLLTRKTMHSGEPIWM